MVRGETGFIQLNIRASVDKGVRRVRVTLPWDLVGSRVKDIYI